MRKMFTVLVAAVAATAALVASRRWLRRSREDTKWDEAARPGRIIDVDGLAVHYVEAGSGPAIVMAHGFGGHTFSFRHQIAEFSKDHRCVAIDLKGFGYTERAPGDYSLTAQARLVLRTMDVLGIEQATLVGHSMGGEVVMRAAAMAPQRVEKLVLAASVSGDRVPLLPRVRFFRPFMPGFVRVGAMNAWRRMFYDRKQVDERAIREAYLAPARIHGSTNTIWEMWADTRKDAPIDYSRITMPVLILWADTERIIPFASYTLRRLLRRLPQAVVERIPRTGHLLLEENPDAANDAIRRFLASRAEKPVRESVDVMHQPA